MGDIINILMDTYNEERVIQIGNLLDKDEQEDHATLLHEFYELFSLTYSNMPSIDDKNSYA
jgi:hypothetical protein